MNLKNFLSLARSIDRSTDLKVEPDSDLRLHFSRPGGPARPGPLEIPKQRSQK